LGRCCGKSNKLNLSDTSSRNGFCTTTGKLGPRWTDPPKELVAAFVVIVWLFITLSCVWECALLVLVVRRSLLSRLMCEDGVSRPDRFGVAKKRFLYRIKRFYWELPRPLTDPLSNKGSVSISFVALSRSSHDDVTLKLPVDAAPSLIPSRPSRLSLIFPTLQLSFKRKRNRFSLADGSNSLVLDVFNNFVRSSSCKTYKWTHNLHYFPVK
jgi:hypothetical protein